MYAIVSTGGKQYRVERGQTLLVERLPVDEGKSCTLAPLLYVDGEQVLDSSQDGLAVRVEARVVAHERGPKLRVVKFKPKRGYKRRTGHRQELTRIEITAIEAGEAGQGGQAVQGSERPRRARAKKEGSGTSGRARRAPTPPKEESDGS
jgi:large subunit ribosomal protein L21